MAHGLTVLNTSGFTQIDQNFKSLEIIQSGSISLSSVVGTHQDGSVYSTYSGGLTLTGFSTPPLVFIKWESSTSYVCVSYISNTRINFLGCNVNSTTFSGGTMSYILAMPSGSDTLTNFGINILNSSGQTVFTSNRKYARVVSLSIIDTTLALATGPYGADSFGYSLYDIYIPNKRSGVFPSIYTTPYVCMSNSNIILGIYAPNYIGTVVNWGVRTRGAGVLEIAAISSDVIGSISCYDTSAGTMTGSNTAVASLPPFLIAI